MWLHGDWWAVKIWPAGRGPQQGEYRTGSGSGWSPASLHAIHAAQDKIAGSAPAHWLTEIQKASQDGVPLCQVALWAFGRHAGSFPTWPRDLHILYTSFLVSGCEEIGGQSGKTVGPPWPEVQPNSHRGHAWGEAAFFRCLHFFQRSRRLWAQSDGPWQVSKAGHDLWICHTTDELPREDVPPLEEIVKLLWIGHSNTWLVYWPPHANQSPLVLGRPQWSTQGDQLRAYWMKKKLAWRVHLPPHSLNLPRAEYLR